MSTYAPGTVAVATVEGVAGVRVMMTENGDWRSAVRIGGTGIVHDDSRVTDVRPLVVLDLEHPSLTATVLRQVGEYIRKQHKTSVEDDQVADFLADQIEAQTKPPRIDEPGRYGIVKANVGSGGPWKFVQTEYGWVCLDDGSCYAWESLIDPVLIREGVES